MRGGRGNLAARTGFHLAPGPCLYYITIRITNIPGQKPFDNRLPI